MVSRLGELVQAAAEPYSVRSGNALTACAGRDNHQTRAHDLRKVIERLGLGVEIALNMIDAYLPEFIGNLQ